MTYATGLLKDSLKRALARIATQYAVSIETPTIKDAFKNLCNSLHYLDTYYSSHKIVCMGMNFVFDETKDRAKRNPNHRNIDACALRVYRRENVERDLEAVQGDIQPFVVQAGRFVPMVDPTTHASPYKLRT